MNVFQKLFATKKAFVGYITAGHRGLRYTEEAAQALVNGGVDILEIGVPFSDPIADGPVIQEAMMDALTHAVSLSLVMETIHRIKKNCSAPIVLFTYFNPLLAMGLERAVSLAAQSGVDGILVVDLPMEEATDYFAYCQTHKVQAINLISPTTDTERLTSLKSYCQSFLYYVCRNGVTGIKNSLPEEYAAKIKAIKEHTQHTVVSGFGIGDKKMAAQALHHADGFVVGSAFVQAISNGASPSDLQRLAIEIDPR